MNGRSAFLDVFTRLNNRQRRFNAEHFRKAGYPEVVFTGTGTGNWQKLHTLCQEQFIDRKGRYTYTWCGSNFFFTNEEDTHVFRALLYML